MRDDFLSADWSTGHRAITRDIHKAFASMAKGLAWLNCHQWQAPWHHDQRSERNCSR